MYRTIHQPHLHCVYRELQLSFISLLSLSLTYVGNILVRRYRPLTPCCALIFLRTYPAVPLPCSPRPQRASRAPDLHTSASTSARLQRVSRAPELHTSTPARLRRALRALELHTSLPPRPHTYITPPELHSRAPELH